ncbi:PREDICTED: uncharacterized protein LOC106811176 [Priapulus caudatus]|uniref:Uncharacterized protein LOC106811176 n=1 Tax=Priapulus caudatus TaxID=37621 RepID=A0ABM1EDD5_PRICU|nr:PREDICTED: uncharacterized protein LOC106811176 [Priapulus caudatus]
MFNTDLATLMPDQWLNDKVIDGYLTITIKEAQAKKYHAMNCVTVGQIFQGIYRSLSVKHKNMMLSTHNRTLCPVNTGGCHWLLVVVDPEKKIDLLQQSWGKCGHDPQTVAQLKRFPATSQRK